MAHPFTFPTLFDEVLTISTTSLKKWGYLKPNQYKSGTITWSQGGNKTGSISIKVDTTQEPPFIELDYKFRDEPRKYKIELTTLPSNLGRGEIYYFICPQTGKRALKLYLIDGYFLHREAFQGCMYECQTYSKKTRKLYKDLDLIFYGDKKTEKYFKKFYNGKPTRKYKKMIDKLRKASMIDTNHLLNF